MVRKVTKWHLMIPFLGDYQRQVILADMEREIGISHQALKKYVDSLVNGNILIKEKKPKNILYRLNKDNPMVLNYLSAAEKIVLENKLEKITLLKRLYETLSPHMTHSNFLVFGSSAGGNIGQDIDILKVGKAEIKEEISRFKDTYGKEIHLVNSEDFSLNKALTREVIKKHLIFNGFDSFVKWFWNFTWKN